MLVENRIIEGLERADELIKAGIDWSMENVPPYRNWIASTILHVFKDEIMRAPDPLVAKMEKITAWERVALENPDEEKFAETIVRKLKRLNI